MSTRVLLAALLVLAMPPLAMPRPSAAQAASGPLVPFAQRGPTAQCISIEQGVYVFRVTTDGSVWAATYANPAGTQVGGHYISQGTDRLDFNGTKGKLSDQTSVQLRVNTGEPFSPITAKVKATFAQGKLGTVRITDASNGLKITFRGLVSVGDC